MLAGIYMLFLMLSIIIVIVPLCIIFQQAGGRWWQVLIPFWNSWKFARLAGCGYVLSSFFCLGDIATRIVGLLIVLYGAGTLLTGLSVAVTAILFVLSIFVNVKLAKRFSQHWGFGVAMSCMPFAFYPLFAAKSKERTDNDGHVTPSGNNTLFVALLPFTALGALLVSSQIAVMALPYVIALAFATPSILPAVKQGDVSGKILYGLTLALSAVVLVLSAINIVAIIRGPSLENINENVAVNQSESTTPSATDQQESETNSKNTETVQVLTPDPTSNLTEEDIANMNDEQLLRNELLPNVVVQAGVGYASDTTGLGFQNKPGDELESDEMIETQNEVLANNERIVFMCVTPNCAVNINKYPMATLDQNTFSMRDTYYASLGDFNSYIVDDNLTWVPGVITLAGRECATLEATDKDGVLSVIAFIPGTNGLGETVYFSCYSREALIDAANRFINL